MFPESPNTKHTLENYGNNRGLYSLLTNYLVVVRWSDVRNGDLNEASPKVETLSQGII